jgi:regulator of replication initiation timing
MNKPLVFNYRNYEDLRKAYKELLADNNTLMAENRKLRKEIFGLEMEIRVLRAYKGEET